MSLILPHRHPGGNLFRQLVDLFQFYMSFPINDHTGEPLAEDTVVATHYDKVNVSMKYVRGIRMRTPCAWSDYTAVIAAFNGYHHPESSHGIGAPLCFTRL